MNRKYLKILVVALLLGGAAMLVAPTAGNASILNITSVVVNVNGTIFNIWTPFTLNPPASAGPHTALLTQNGGTFNFDASDLCIPNSACIGVQPTITVNLSGVGNHLTYTDLANHLGIPVPGDNSANPPRETVGYFYITGTCSSAGTANCADLNLKIGYADDAHLQGGITCGTPANPNDPNGNCRPDPFTADIIQSSGASPGCANPAVSGPTCLDTGVLLLQNIQTPHVTPEPATLFLLGAGLLGVGIWARRRGGI